MSGPRVGVVSLQGASALHAEALGALGAVATEVRGPSDLEGIDALVLPGGESTTMAKLAQSSGLFDATAERLADGMAVFGTCAGMILLAAEVLDGRRDQSSFGVIDISVRRNAFGRQRDSFEVDLEVAGLSGPSFPGVFIRAPVVERSGAKVEVLAEVHGRSVLCRQDKVLVAAFHPELVGDLRLHRMFLDLISEAGSPPRLLSPSASSRGGLE